MDFLFNVAGFIGDWIAAAIEQVTGWHPDERAKNIIDWIGILSSAFLGIWGIGALIRGGRTVRINDIEKLRTELKEEFRAVLSAREAATVPIGGGPAPSADAGLAQNLDAAIDTLLKAGKGEALKDKTGVAAEAALDALIAGRATARQRVASDEASLWRQKGALAFLHDTAAALRAYAMATELDPDDTEGWNQLGHLQSRVGDLDAAVASYERMLTLGNRRADQETIAAATGNLGIVYATRGDLDQAEAMFRKALALDETLGRKEGMANQYGNLGLVYETHGDLDQARVHWRQALSLYHQIGAKPMIERVEGWLREAGDNAT